MLIASKFITLTKEGIDKAEELAAHAEHFVATLEQHLPIGRELSLAKTKIEEALLFAEKGLATVHGVAASAAAVIAELPLPPVIKAAAETADAIISDVTAPLPGHATPITTVR